MWGVDEALAEITARQHALDDEFAQPQLFDAPAADPADKRAAERPAASSAIEQQLADIATQIKALQGSMHFDGLAADLTRTIEQASPKRSIEAVEEQLRRLASQIEAARDRSRRRSTSICCATTSPTSDAGSPMRCRRRPWPRSSSRSAASPKRSTGCGRRSVPPTSPTRCARTSPRSATRSRNRCRNRRGRRSRNRCAC